MSDQQDQWMDVAKAIAQLRTQLAVARAAGEADESGVYFKVGKAEIELAMEARREGRLGGGVKFWVVSADASGTLASNATHRLRLELTPHDLSGDDIDVSHQAKELPHR